MLKKLLASMMLLFSLQGALVAQAPPATPTAPHHFEIHDQNGALPWDIYVSYGFTDINGWRWYFCETKDRRTGAIVGRGLLLLPPGGEGTYLRSYSDDSGLWYDWVWSRDHYDKVGGTPAVRSYWPK